MRIIKTKTFWAGLSLVGYGVVNIASGNYQEGVQNILEGLAFIFLRSAIAKGG